MSSSRYSRDDRYARRASTPALTNKGKKVGEWPIKLYRIVQEGRCWLITIYKWKRRRDKWCKLYVFTSHPGATLRATIKRFREVYENRGPTYRRVWHRDQERP